MIDCPYVGLDPFGPDQAAFFFAREFERDTIINNMMGARLTVVCGPSGVGKSSVLGAGVLHQLRKQAAEAVRQGHRPRFVGCVFPSLSKADTAVPEDLKTWTSEPVDAILRSLQREIALVLPARDAEALQIRGSLSETLATWSASLDTTFLIVLDQFEECFLYHERGADPGRFAREVADAINAPGLAANFLFSIREDALAKLDRLKGVIPGVYGNQLPLDYLDRASALEAVTGPIKRYNELLAAGTEPISIDPELVEAVLDGVRSTADSIAGHPVPTGEAEGLEQDTAAAIDTTYLQLVMTRLWSEEKMPSGSRALRLSTLNRLGGVKQLVERHLDEAMQGLTRSQRRAATSILGYLVTPEGSKIALSSNTLAEWTELKQALVASVLLDLAGRSRRVLRSVPGERFELYHDKLAPAVLDWTRVARSRDQRARTAWKVGGVLILFAGVGAAALIYQKSGEWRRNSERADQIAKADQAMSAAHKSLLASESDQGTKHYGTALNIYQGLGEPRKALDASLGMARAYQLGRNDDAALSSYETALQLADSLVPADFAARATARERLASLKEGKREVSEARSLYEEAVLAYKSAQDEQGAGRALERLASLKEAAKEIPEATRSYIEAIHAYKTAQDAPAAGRLQERLAIYSEKSGEDKHRAIEWYKQARQSFSLAGDSAAMMRTDNAVLRLTDWGFLLDLHTGRPLPLSGPEVNVGRNSRSLRNEVFIEGNRCISRRHLVIHAEHFGAEDWRTRSGTSVNGQPLPYGDVRKLKNRDIIVMANSHAVQFLQSRPAPVRIPKAAWAVFVDGAAKRYQYLTEREYSVNPSGRGYALAPATEGKSPISLRRSANGTAELKYSGEAEIYVKYKDPNHDYKYIEGVLKRDDWYGADFPLLYRTARAERPNAANSAWFQVIRVQPPEGCRDTPRSSASADR